jgi:hypothetical protein
MKGLGRSAALLGMSGAASLILTLGPGLGIAHAIDDNGGNRNDNRGCNILDGNKDRRDGRDGKDGLDNKDDGLDNKDDGLNNNDWFNWDDKNKDNKDNRRDGDCIIGAGVGVGVGVGVVGAGVGAGAGAGVGAGAGGGAPAGGVGAGGGGMAGDSTPLLPLAGAGLGAILLTAGVATRRRGQGAS